MPVSTSCYEDRIIAQDTAHVVQRPVGARSRHLPVLDGDQPVGIVSIRDLMALAIEDEAPRGA